MSVTGISGASQILAQSLSDLGNQLDDLQRQLGSGNKSDTYAGLGASRGLSVGLRTQLSALSSYDDTMTLVGTRLTVAQTALQQIATSSQAVSSAAANSSFQLNTSGQTIDQATATGQLGQMIDALNSQVGDQYIFSGKSPDQQSVASLSDIMNGTGSQAGFIQVMSERRQADLGADGLGRLVIGASGSTVSVAEDAVSPFGMKLASVTSNLTGAVVSGPSGSPAGASVDLSGASIASGDTIRFTFSLPDGTTQDVTLTATAAYPPGANQFTIGATPAATAANLNTALTSAVQTTANTTLVAASAMAAANDFFNTDGSDPPRRVAGPPFDTATALAPDTGGNTVLWYTGEDGTDPARSTATARIDPDSSVSFGMRADETSLRSAIANTAVFAAMSFSSSDPNASAQYQAMTQRVGSNLGSAQGASGVASIETEIAAAQSAIASAQDRHQQTSASLTDLLQSIENVSPDQVGAQLLDVQTRLQASLETTALLSQLSLVNYLMP